MSEVVAVIGGITKDEQYLYYSDTLAQRIRRVDSQGNTTILVGNGMGYFNGDNIPASTASVNLPCSLEIGNDQNLYFADKGNRRIRRITIRDAVPKITTVVSSDVIPNNFSMTSMRLGSNGEFYVAPVYNQLIERELHIGVWNIGDDAGNGMHGLGTPADLEIFNSNPRASSWCQ